jgi:hypothetical protein
VVCRRAGWHGGRTDHEVGRASSRSGATRPGLRRYGGACPRGVAYAFLVGLTSFGCAGATPPADPGGVDPVPMATPSPGSSGGQSEALIAFRLVAPDEASGVEAVTLDGQVIWLESEVMASDDDLARPRFTPREGGWVLDVRFDADSGVRFDQALLDHYGREVALVVDAAVWRVLEVRPQLGASVVRATSNLADGDASRLQQRIDQRWP